MNTTENNKLIAEFMGSSILLDPDNKETPFTRPDYENDWNDLMQVIEKIESLYNGGFEVGIHHCSTIIGQCRSTPYGKLHNQVNLFEITASEGYNFERKIQYTYEAVVQFIKWYNKNK
jgi:hypothetical protein